MQVASLNTTKLLLAALDDDTSDSPPLSLVIHVGDLSYAQGFDAQWDEYFSQIEPIAKVGRMGGRMSRWMVGWIGWMDEWMGG
jgi:hypothetical protein